jgi:hypothetical protein
MTVFVVSRRNHPEQPLLLVAAEDADEAVVKIEEQEEVGTLLEQGYRDAPEGYTAFEANEALRSQWKASVEDGISDGILDAESKASEWVIFLREPEFDPGLEQIEAPDDC